MKLSNKEPLNGVKILPGTKGGLKGNLHSLSFLQDGF